MSQVDWERRAVAAEKTVAVLKDRVRALLNGSRGVLDRQLERARLREERNRRRHELVTLRAAELEKTNARLEAAVAERTRALTTILDNVTSGLLLVGPDLRVREGYTRSCVRLFGTADIAGRRFLEVVGPSSSDASLELFLNEVFDDVLPEEVTLGQFPSHLRLAGGRTLELLPRVIRDAAGRIEALLLIVNDVSELEGARREAQENAALLGVLRNRPAFLGFLDDVRDEVRRARHAAADPDEQPTVRRLLHTLKGNAASFGMSDVCQLIHQVEEEPFLGVAEIDRVEGAFRQFLARHRAILDVSWEQTAPESFSVSARRIEELRRHLDALDVEAARAWVEGVCERPVRDLLGPVDQMVARLARRFGKQIRLVLEGADVPVDPARMRPVLRVLAHLLRNSVDHGIEPPGARGLKPAEAELRVAIEAADGAWHVRVRDDGRGIDERRLLQRAVESGVMSEVKAAALCREERLALVFADGLSAAEQVTDISGRGVGMAAVRQAVEQVGGEILVKSQPGEGTEIAIRVPMRPAAPSRRPGALRRVTP